MIVGIDPGHGGKFNNAVGNGLIEKDLVLKYAGYLGHQLQYRGHQVVMTRDADINLDDNLNNDLLARAQIANLAGCDCLISLHCNAWKTPDAEGFEVWTSPGQTRSDYLAEEIITSTKKSFPMAKYRADMTDGDLDKESKFVVLIRTTMSAVLIEIGFLTNLNEARRISNQTNIIAYTEAWADALENWEREWLI